MENSAVVKTHSIVFYDYPNYHKPQRFYILFCNDKEVNGMDNKPLYCSNCGGKLNE